MPCTSLSTRIAGSVAKRAAVRQQKLLCHPCYFSTSTRPYCFHIGASWAGKPPDRQRISDKLSKPFPASSAIGAWRDQVILRPKALATRDAGEDFFFIQEMKNHSGVALGVADGVGGWIESGVDPSLFAQAIMYHAHRYARSAWAGEPEVDPTQDYEEREQLEGWELTPLQCLDLAYDAVLREKHVEAGSSTACILTLNCASGILRAANLGDSGFSIIRASSIFYRQQAQSHFFNCPKQLTKHPATGRKFSRVVTDLPSEADVYETRLRDGDIVIAYTDGFSDNVFQDEMIALYHLVARAGGSEDQQIQTIADRLVDHARHCMHNKWRTSPFEKEAARQGMFFRGGKPDDVTIVAALVRETM